MNVTWPTWSDAGGPTSGSEHYNAEDADVYLRNLILKLKAGGAEPQSRVGDTSVESLIRDSAEPRPAAPDWDFALNGSSTGAAHVNA